MIATDPDNKVIAGGKDLIKLSQEKTENMKRRFRSR
jgi:hypothetical protein